MDFVLGGAMLLLIAVVGMPFAGSAYRRVRRRRRRRLVDAPRKIPIAASDLQGRQGCEDGQHGRDGDRVRPDGRNGYNSVCRRCGVPMNRARKGEWRVVEAP